MNATWDKVNLAPIVLIKGGEELLAERARDRLIAQGKKEGLSTISIDASTYSAGELAVHMSPSLFGGGNLVIASKLKEMNDEFLDDAMALVTDPSPDAALVAIHEGGNRGQKLLKAIESAGFPVVAIAPIKKDADKAALLRADAKRAGHKVDDAAIGALVDALGSDLRELTSALAQLMADTDGVITAETVHTYYSGRVEATGFAVADAAIAGRDGRALSLLRHAISTGIEPVLIVSALALKLRQLALVADAQERREAPKLQMAPWQIDRARRELSGWSSDQLGLAITAVAECDGEVKGFGGAKDPAYSMEKCIRTICAARRRR